MRHRELLLRIVLLMLLLYALAHFASARETLRRTELLAQELQETRDDLYAEQLALTERMNALLSGEGLEAAARERLGLVMPGERVFYVREEEEAARSPD